MSRESACFCPSVCGDVRDQPSPLCRASFSSWSSGANRRVVFPALGKYRGGSSMGLDGRVWSAYFVRDREALAASRNYRRSSLTRIAHAAAAAAGFLRLQRSLTARCFNDFLQCPSHCAIAYTKYILPVSTSVCFKWRNPLILWWHPFGELCWVHIYYFVVINRLHSLRLRLWT